jgi:hypothetical protein
MRYSEIKLSIVHQFAAPGGNRIVPFIIGAPGGGKSACARDVVRTMGIQNVVEFTASLRDPVDILGTPDNRGEYTRWVPPAEFWRLREGVGPCALILEELSDATVPVQNALCGVIYDRKAGDLRLSDQLFIIATGNRTEDRSGANRITSKLANRTRRFDFTESIDDWADWALEAGVDHVLIQFLRFRPDLLSDFDPNRFANPTPRKWEAVSLIPSDLPDHLFFENVAGEVGEGAAAEYVGFRRIYASLPDVDKTLANPEKADVPTDPATKYALMGALAHKANNENFASVCAYLARVEPEFAVMCIRDAIKRCPDIKRTKEFANWAVKNANVLM